MNWFARRSTDIASMLALIILTAFILLPDGLTALTVLTVGLLGERRLKRAGRSLRRLIWSDDETREELRSVDGHSILIHGPQGCGKSRVSNDLRRFFRMDCVVDEVFPRDPRLATKGAVFLTSASPELFGKLEGVAVLSFKEAEQRMHFYGWLWD